MCFWANMLHTLFQWLFLRNLTLPDDLENRRKVTSSNLSWGMRGQVHIHLWPEITQEERPAGRKGSLYLGLLGTVSLWARGALPSQGSRSLAGQGTPAPQPVLQQPLPCTAAAGEQL